MADRKKKTIVINRQFGPGFLSCLGLLLIGLKLGGAIDWHWLIVLLPLLWWLYGIVAIGLVWAAWEISGWLFGGQR